MEEKMDLELELTQLTDNANSKTTLYIKFGKLYKRNLFKIRFIEF